MRQDRTGKDRTGKDRTVQGRTGKDREGQDRTGQDRTGQGRTGCDVKKPCLRDVGTFFVHFPDSTTTTIIIEIA